MRISEAAELAGLKVSNVRFYERKGLLTPAREADSKYRDYSQEDVQRMKQILLYRKMGVSIDTIYLLLNGKAEMKDILLRQKQELEMQMENLQGAIELCGMVLQEEQLNEEKLNHYLNYVHREEDKGMHFAEAAELIEDITEFTISGVFHWDSLIIRIFRRPWLAGVISVSFWILCISVPVLHIISAAMGKNSLNIFLIAFFVMILTIYGTGFAAWRRERKNQREEEMDK